MSARQFTKHSSAKSRNFGTSLINDAQLAHVIADALDPFGKAHPLGKIVTQPPEIDNEAAAALRGRTLDQSRLEARGVQPKSQSRPGNSPT